MIHSRISPSLGRWGLWLLLGTLLTAALALASADSAQAIPRLSQCTNNIDDDGDGKIDFPAESGCTGPNDPLEAEPSAQSRACSNGTSTNDSVDGDTLVDYPDDPGCLSARDNTEDNPATLPDCGDGADSDGDGKVDYPADRGCISASDPSERDTACSDGNDNDGDGDIDFPFDWGCAAPIIGPNQTDASEVDPAQCNDGRDNDADGTLDTDTNVAGQTKDPGCSSPADDDETDPAPPIAAPPACSDTIDNDLDGKVDYPNDPGCVSRLDTDETDTPRAPAGGSTGQPVGPSSLSRAYPLVSPFPVIRLRGRADRAGVLITLLRVQAPNGTRVTIYCKGRSCKRRKTSEYTITGFVRARAFEKRLRAGTTLSIYVTKAGFTGKYTRFRINKSSPPSRRDRCARSAGRASVACPVN
ncbi:MAG: hypothetical protein QOK16_3622 [Solirubrobacteraceae bacterium]|nr:hypothetical protein [Solirubrobacteraceae bacterium]